MSSAEAKADESKNSYTIRPEETGWWEEVNGTEEIDEVYRVFEEAGVDPEYGRSEEFISPEYAFSEEEIDSIRESVEDFYDEFDEFVEEVKVSDVHPQQSMQIIKYHEYSDSDFIDGVPAEFSDFDGMPVLERNTGI